MFHSHLAIWSLSPWYNLFNPQSQRVVQCCPGAPPTELVRPTESLKVPRRSRSQLFPSLGSDFTIFYQLNVDPRGRTPAPLQSRASSASRSFWRLKQNHPWTSMNQQSPPVVRNLGQSPCFFVQLWLTTGWRSWFMPNLPMSICSLAVIRQISFWIPGRKRSRNVYNVSLYVSLKYVYTKKNMDRERERVTCSHLIWRERIDRIRRRKTCLL